MKVDDARQNKDISQQLALSKRLIAGKVDAALRQTQKFLGEYSVNQLKDLSICLVDGKVGEGTINETVIELQLPSGKQTQTDELIIALTASTALHEGVHGLLDSRPGSMFSSDFEAVTGINNEHGKASTLLDEGIAYAIQGIYASSYIPVAKETDDLLVKQRKSLGEKLGLVVKDYINSGKRIDSDFFKAAQQAMIQIGFDV